MDFRRVCLFGFLLAFPTYSNDTLSLDRLIVRAARIKEYSPSKVTLEAKDFSGKYLDLQSVLETVSGVSLCTMGGFGHYSDVAIRGSSPSQVQVYLDGIPLNGATGNAVDISKIPFASLQTISVYKTAPELEYFGDNAGGVINLTSAVTKDLTTASTEIGSFGYRDGSAMLNKTIGPITHRLFINYGWADNNYPYTDSIITRGPTIATDDSLKKMDNNFYSTFSSIYSNDYTINTHTKLTSQFSTQVSNEGIFYLPQASSNDGTIRKSMLSLVESYATKFDSCVSITLTAKGKTENDQFRRFRPFYLGTGPFLYDISQPYASLESIIKAHVGDFLDIAGIASTGYNGFDFNNLLITSSQLQPQYFRITGKIGLESNIKWGKAFSARIGGIYRYEIDSTNDSLTPLGALPGGGLTKKGFPNGFSELRYRLFEDFGVLASVQYSSRSPGFSEKYSKGANFSGNAALRPETRLEYDLGFSLLKSYFALSGSFFISSTLDKIIYTMNAARMFTPKNVSGVNGIGIENDAVLTPCTFLSIANSLTFMENIVHSDVYPSWNSKDEPLLPRLIDNVSVKLRYNHWYASHSAHFTTRYFTDFDNTDSVQQRKPQLTASIGALVGEHFDVSYRIENYLNIQDYDFQRPLPGLSQYIVLKCTF